LQEQLESPEQMREAHYPEWTHRVDVHGNIVSEIIQHNMFVGYVVIKACSSSEN
jgi:hypothetical protein